MCILSLLVKTTQHTIVRLAFLLVKFDFPAVPLPYFLVNFFALFPIDVLNNLLLFHLYYGHGVESNEAEQPERRLPHPNQEGTD